ncbi:membrane protein [Bacillus sonorensis]|nr:membrane protein [Bacillus sonorensis]
MYWFLGALLYFLVGTCIFIGVIRGSHSGSWILLALAAPFIIVGYPYFYLKQHLAKR